ncbi:protein kinase domain-containing protein [Umezawaea sp. Da 62-37]|uniref:protein kinase domain-containing protein n=1 Tax=Umezawaea sp. Da 62-37 TaxID=3075927 RepID=UPI0028F74D28|nr:protein kinase [Umezawaea sp. Da 62-37]WNV86180.1 protein kinase [Umezawaea sp. Da 62-37]
MVTPDEDPLPLATGPVAVVYAAGQDALKVFPGPLDRRTRTALDHEIGAWQRIPATVEVRGVEEMRDGRVVVRVELCPDSLVDRVRREGVLAADVVVDVAGRLGRALETAHAAGLVHGGVAPGNVLFRVSGEPVLADGGLVLRGAFPVEASVEFAAPETVRDAVRDARTDLYGLGAVLFFACTGRAPHPARLGERPDEHVLRVLAAPVPEVDRPDLPEDVRELVRTLLAKDPGQRRLADHHRARVPVAEAKPEPKAEHGRLGLVAGVVTALGLFAAAPFLLLRDDPPPPSPAAPTMDSPAGIELVEVTDGTDHVRLTWRSPRAGLVYLVITAPEGKPRGKSAELDETTLDVPVEPGLRYCFEIQGSDGKQVYVSAPTGIRGATCAR